MVAFIRVDEKPHHDSPSLPISLARASRTSRPFLCRRGDYRAGNDRKVIGLVCVAAFAHGESESINSVSKPYPPAPLGSGLRSDAQGFLTATRKGIAEDMAGSLGPGEQQILTATQGRTSASVFRRHNQDSCVEEQAFMGRNRGQRPGDSAATRERRSSSHKVNFNHRTG